MINAILLQVNQAATMVSDTTARVAQQIPVATPAKLLVDEFSLLDLLIKGGPIMIPVAFLSLIAVYVFVERYIVLRKASREDVNFMNNIRDFMHNGRVDSALTFCHNNNTPIARMIEKGIKRLGQPLKEIGESIEIVGKFEVYKLEKNIVILGIVAGIAPMLGFIGTIIGVIKIFHDISLAGDVSIATVSSGLYTKMVSSAAGLIVGICAFVLYHWLNIMVEKTVHKLERNAMEFLDVLQEPSK
ncbi:MAG: MotA/TolQ/ExbB proton channel family protein [Bacteroidales bacterium]